MATERPPGSSVGYLSFVRHSFASHSRRAGFALTPKPNLCYAPCYHPHSTEWEMHGWRGDTAHPRPQSLRPDPRTRAKIACVYGGEGEREGGRGRGGHGEKALATSLRYYAIFLLFFQMFWSLTESSYVCSSAPLKIILRTRSFDGVITHQLLSRTERTNSSKYWITEVL